MSFRARDLKSLGQFHFYRTHDLLTENLSTCSCVCMSVPARAPACNYNCLCVFASTQQRTTDSKLSAIIFCIFKRNCSKLDYCNSLLSYCPPYFISKLQKGRATHQANKIMQNLVSVFSTSFVYRLAWNTNYLRSASTASAGSGSLFLFLQYNPRR